MPGVGAHTPFCTWRPQFLVSNFGRPCVQKWQKLVENGYPFHQVSFRSQINDGNNDAFAWTLGDISYEIQMLWLVAYRFKVASN